MLSIPVFAQGPIIRDTSIRPFHVHISDKALAELRQRIRMTRWPEMETVNGKSQGVRLVKLEELARYWGSGYDWRRAEAKLNALPQYVTNIDGLDIYFIRVRSKEPNALPIIITHGWPGSVFEQLKVIGPLTNPAAYGGKASDAFDVVIPSLPGVGFSGKPPHTGWGPEHIARAWAVLMKRLGYTHYVAQGGDWGSPISGAMARQAPNGLLGIHINLPATVPPEIASILTAGGPVPPELAGKERSAFLALDTILKKYKAYSAMMATRPQTIGYSLADSPVGLAAWIYDYNNCEQERTLNKDDILDNISLYWLTNSGTSGGRIYWENLGKSVIFSEVQKTGQISLPVAITVFPNEYYQAPESWARRAYQHLIYFHEASRGGHFAAWEEPQTFAEEMRAAFKSLR